MTGAKLGRCLVLLCTALPLVAGATEPLYVKNLTPVTAMLGLPSQRSADTVDRGKLSAALHSSIANSYILDADADEYLNLDGETVRLALELRYGLLADWELQLEVAWMDQSGGNLDQVIDDWHDFWGMSDGGRDQVPRDLLDYRYATPDGGFGLQDDTSGLGDTSLSLSHAFYRDGDAVASLALGYKFGTGDEDDFLGSGADDGFVALRFSGQHLAQLPLGWHGQVGYLRAGDSDLLGDSQEQNLWFAGIAVDWQLAQNWSLLAQVDSNAAPLDSDLKGVGGEAYLITVGGRWRFAQHWSADISVIEDIRVQTGPDVTFQASVRYRP